MMDNVYRRGQPVVALAVVLTAWVAVRAAVWDPSPQKSGGVAEAFAPIVPMPVVGSAEGGASELALHRPPPDGKQRTYGQQPSLYASAREEGGVVGTADIQTRWADAISSQGRLPQTTPSVPPPVPYVSPDAHPGTRRWSADGWMLLRDRGGFGPVTAPTRATYGASQLGAVVRYRLSPESGHRPTAYLRGTAALVRPYDREVATGLSVRPVPGVPLTVAAEVRAGEINSTTRIRPAIMAVTELPPQKLPLNLLGEAYAQAGYVGGAGETAFVDGQLRVDAALARMGRAELRFGGGAWGGAQKDASRFDIGPALNMGVSVSDAVFARVMIDWRFRVAGNAVPESGPTLTLSAGF